MDIKGLSLAELQQCLRKYDLPVYRASQIYAWIYQKRVCRWEEMTNIPKELQKILCEAGLSIGCLEVIYQDEAADGTIKYLFQLQDGQRIESVYLPETDRRTICFSTQVGCGMGCLFCATGRNGLGRNLTPGEIIDQILRINTLVGVRTENLVAMGQGEPLANYESLLKALFIINDAKGLGIGARHITISTCGIVPGILKLAEEALQVNLAISLHAADNKLRDHLMPINKTFPLPKLLEACRFYLARTGRRITFEYTLIDGINDRPEDLKNLQQLLRGILCHVNLIPLNIISESDFKRSRPQRIREFAAALNQVGIETTVRKERGSELVAACGQLQGKGPS